VSDDQLHPSSGQNGTARFRARSLRASRRALSKATFGVVLGLLAVQPAFASQARSSQLPRSAGQSWTNNLHVEEGPTAAGNAALVTATLKNQLEEVALNPATGGAEWSVPSTLSLIPPIVLVPPLAIDGVAVVLTPSKTTFNGYGAGIEGITIATGKLAWSEGASVGVLAPPTTCAGPKGLTYVCIIVNSKVGGKATLTVLDPRSGHVVEQDSGLGVPLASSLYETVGQPAMLSRFSPEAGFGWRRTVAAITGQKTYNVDFQTPIDLIDGVYVVTFDQTTHGYVADLADYMTVGVSAATGKTLWKDLGAFECGGLTVVTGDYLCRESGSLTVNPGQSPVLSKAAATIEGLNYATGATTWKFRVGDLENFLGGAGVELASSGQLVVPNSSGTSQLLDLRSGTTHTEPAGSVFWCPSEEEFADATDPTDPVDRIGTESLSECGLGRKASSLPIAPPPTAVQAGGDLLWAANSGVDGTPASGS
jgi:hypothetical protein